MKPNDRLEVHFLNVDHGDSTIIRHPGDEHRKKGRVSFVDINDWQHRRSEENSIVAGLSSLLSSNSRAVPRLSEEEYAKKYLDDPIEYFRSQVAERGQDIWRFICTHPDMDHISGLKRLCNEEDITVFWDIKQHSKDLSDTDDWHEKFDKEDWEKYAEIRDNETSHNYLTPRPGSQKQYWEQDRLEILHPSREFALELDDKKSPNYNDISYVLKLNTRAGSVLLPGDAEEAAWEKILEKWGKDKLEDVRILKASHHGRDSGFHREAVQAMNPEYVIVSVGAKDSSDAYDKYAQACSSDTEILSTRQYGTISFTISNRGSLVCSKSEPDGIFNLPTA
jgi:beta-lactamase superfamily II metal-dependent hydrolase